MSLDKKICPKCNSNNVKEKEEHNLLNLAMGLSIWTGVGVATDNMGLIALAPLFYFFDMPFGPDKNYYCNSCYNNWK